MKSVKNSKSSRISIINSIKFWEHRRYNNDIDLILKIEEEDIDLILKV